MRAIADFLIGLVALEHFAFLVLEMFFWKKPIGLRIFSMTQQVADSSAALAANQGLYNGFLAAGLFWGLTASPPAAAPIKTFFLCCVVVAGIYGAMTANARILFIQAAPALAALAFLRLSRG